MRSAEPSPARAASPSAASPPQAPGARALPSDRMVVAAQALALASLAAAAFAVRWPTLLDYPNHYARLWLLAGGAQVPPVSEMYRIDWHNASTNLAIDLVGALLGRVVPVAIVAPALLVAALVLPPLGAALVNRAVFRGAHWWHVAMVTLAWGVAVIAGFLNFEIGLGLALLAAAVDPWLQARHPAIAVIARSGLGAIVLLAHAFAFLFYLVLLGALALGPEAAPLRRARGFGRAVGRAVRACLPALVPLVLLVAFAPRLPEASRGLPDIEWQSWRSAGRALLSAFATYQAPVDALFVLALALPVAWAALTRRLRIHAGMFAAAVVLGLASNFMPRGIGGTFWIDKRLPVMTVLVLAAAIRPELAPARLARWAVLAFALAVPVARSAWVARVWSARQADVAAVERVLAHVPSGAAVLPLDHRPSDRQRARAPVGRYMLRAQPTYWHLAALAIPERKAFVPTLFTAAGKQPLVVRPPWNQISVPEGPPSSVDGLDRPGSEGRAPYLARWRERFGYVLVVNADLPNEGGPLPPEAPLQLVAREGFAELYRVLPPPP